MQLSLIMWVPIAIEDPRGAALADRHYSRQTVGAKGFVPPGRRMAFLYQRDGSAALWAVCFNMDPTGAPRWRNTIFRNETHVLSSSLVEAATLATVARWRRCYGSLPQVPLTTEIDIGATAARRGRGSPPGRCYLEAGWTKVRDIPASHGRPAKVELSAPLGVEPATQNHEIRASSAS